MVPPVIIVVVHYNLTQLTSWVHHGTPGWYVGPSLDRYSCMKYYIPVTGVICVNGIIQYITKIFLPPTTTTEDYLCQADMYILSLL